MAPNPLCAWVIALLMISAQLRQMLSAQASRIRRGGAGRKRVEEVAPALKRELTRIVEETTASDPMSGSLEKSV
jgi:hypothetical protein